jgi:hypothetical protein
MYDAYIIKPQVHFSPKNMSRDGRDKTCGFVLAYSEVALHEERAHDKSAHK